MLVLYGCKVDLPRKQSAGKKGKTKLQGLDLETGSSMVLRIAVQRVLAVCCGAAGWRAAGYLCAGGQQSRATSV
jgi:hypothetical protein